LGGYAKIPIMRGGAPRRDAPTEEILALKPELAPPRKHFPFSK